MNSITVDQVKLLVDKLLRLNPDYIAIERSSSEPFSLKKIQGRFTDDHIILFHFDNYESKINITFKITEMSYFDRHISVSKHPIIRYFNPYYKQWRRLQKHIEKRMSIKAQFKAEKDIAHVSEAIVTMFPEVAEKYLLDD